MPQFKIFLAAISFLLGSGLLSHAIAQQTESDPLSDPLVEAEFCHAVGELYADQNQISGWAAIALENIDGRNGAEIESALKSGRDLAPREVSDKAKTQLFTCDARLAVIQAMKTIPKSESLSASPPLPPGGDVLPPPAIPDLQLIE